HHRRSRRPRAFHSYDQVPQHRVVELERVLQLTERLGVALDIHEHVVRLVHFGERKSELTAAPVLEAVNFAVLRGHRGAVALDHRRHLLTLVRMDDETQFVMSHANSLWMKPPARSTVATRRKQVRQGWRSKTNDRRSGRRSSK